MASKEWLIQEIRSLDEEQLKEVGNFVAFLKFRSRYKEFVQEDCLLAEEGMDEYANILKQEDLEITR